MRKIHVMNLALIITSILTIISPANQALAQTNLLNNPGFETGDTSGWNHWNIGSTVVTTEKYSGSYSIKLQSIGGNEGALLQEITSGFAAGQTLNASAWTKTDAGLGSAKIGVKIEFINGSTPYVTSQYLTGSNDWTRVNVSTTVPSGTTIIKFLLHLKEGVAGNYAYIDDNYMGSVPVGVDYFGEAETFTTQLGGSLDQKDNASKGYTLGNEWGKDNGDYATYALNVGQSDSDVFFDLRYSCADGQNNIISIYLDDVLKGTFTSVSSGSWNNFIWTDKITIGPVTAGTHTLKITSGGESGIAGINLDCFRLYTSANNEILVDDFNDGSDPNKLGGGRGSWGDGSSSTYDSTVYYGASGQSLKLTNTTTTGDEGTFLLLNSLNVYTRAATHLVFYVKGAAGGESFKAGLKDNSLAENKVQVDDSGYIADGIVTTAWKKVVIPLNDFNNPSIKIWDMNNFSVTFTSANNTIYIDDLKFTNSPGMLDYFSEAENYTTKLGGSQIAIGNASGGYVLGDKWGAVSGEYAAYSSIETQKCDDNVVFQVRYSSTESNTTLSIYWDDILKGTISTVNTGGVNEFKWSNKITIGPVIDGVHTLKITSAGQSNGTGINLDCFRLYNFSDTKIIVDDFDDGSDPNKLGGSTNAFGTGSGFAYDSLEHYGASGRSLKLFNTTYTGDEGIYFILNGLNVYKKAATHLIFYVKGALGGESFKVGLKDGSWREKKLQIDGSNYIEGGAITTTWKKVIIPLEDFSNPAVTLWKLNNFSVTFTSANNTIYIDDLKFVHTIGVPEDYTTIQAGIDAAAINRDLMIMRVAAGTYYENVNLKPGVSLKGEGAEKTVIDAGGNGHVIAAADNSTIDGFTLRNSGGDPLNDAVTNSGIYCDSVSPKITNNIITNCKYGISLWGASDPFIANNVISHNSSNGIRVSGTSAPAIYNNTVINSRTGIFSNSSSFSITNNILTNNSDYGIFNQGTLPVISYNDVWNNGVNYFGCGSGTGDISVDPLFVDPTAENYRLKRYLSPCIDAGTNIGLDYGGSAPDMGVFESVRAFASNTENDHPENVPNLAVDGNLNTRWSTDWSDPQWIYIDLGTDPEPYNVVALTWEAAYGKEYDIQVSNDAVNWTTVYTKITGIGGIERVYVGAQTARYIKMYGKKRGTQWGYSLYEFAVEYYNDTVPPSAPSGLSAVSDDSIVFLDGNANPEQDIRGYNIYRSTTPGGPYTKLNTEPVELLKFRDKEVINGTTYYYIVKAVDFAGNESPSSTEISVIPQVSSRNFFSIPSCAWSRYIGDIPTITEGSNPDRGIALGGFGAGSFMYSISGAFGPWHMKIDRGGVKTDWLEAGAFHIYEKKVSGSAVVKTLSTNENIKMAWSKIKIGEGKYYALQPKGWTTYNCFSTDVSSKFFSPIIAFNYKETSYPIAVWQWKLFNPTDEAIDVAVMLTWPNLDERYVCNTRTGFTNSQQFSADITGVVLKAVNAGNPVETQNSEWCIATKANTGATVSFVTSWNANGDGSDVWNDFRDNGILSNDRLDASSSAAAIAIKTTLLPQESKEIPIVISWDFPVVQFTSGTQWWRKYCEYFDGNSDNSFDIASEALNNCVLWEEKVNGWMNLFDNDAVYPDWLKRAAFNELYYGQFGGVFYESGLKQGPGGSTEEFMGLHPEDHKFFVMECQHYYNSEPIDVRHYIPVYAKFWPEIERDVLRCYADAILYYEFPFVLDPPLPPGARMVPHDVGNPSDWVDPFNTGTPYNCDPYFKFDAYRNACPKMPYWKDTHSKFIQQCWRYYYLYKDKEFLDYVWPSCKALYEFMKSTDTDGNYLPNNRGSDNTYDTWGLYGTSTLCGGLWVGALEAMEQIAIIENDPILTEVRTWLYGPGGSGGAKENLNALLWYEYEGAAPGEGYYQVDTGSAETPAWHTATDIMADALNGQRYCELYGLADILPAERMKTHWKEVFNRCVVPLADYVGKFGVGEKDEIGDVGAINGRKVDGSPVGSPEQAEEVWAGTTYFLAAGMYHAGLTEEALLTAYGAYYPVYEDESLAYWFNTPEAWKEDGRDPRPIHAPEQYIRARAVWELMFEIKDPYAVPSVSRISGKVLIQARTNHQDTITFELRSLGQTTPINTYQILTAQDGSYTLYNIPPGTYDLTAKSLNTLRAKKPNITVTAGQTTANIDFSLLGGDCDNNNVVSPLDVSILSAAFGSSQGQPKWDKRADFDNNGIIAPLDASILSSNFGKSGAE